MTIAGRQDRIARVGLADGVDDTALAGRSKRSAKLARLGKERVVSTGLSRSGMHPQPVDRRAAPPQRAARRPIVVSAGLLCRFADKGTDALLFRDVPDLQALQESFIEAQVTPSIVNVYATKLLNAPAG